MPPSRLSRPISLSVGVSILALSAVAQAQSIPVAQMSVPEVVASSTVTGRVAPSAVLNMSVSLEPRNRAAFEALARQVGDPSSTNYHHFLTPAQIGERFGPSQDTVNATVSYLKSKGMTITLVAENRMAILFKGRADRVENTFSTKLMTYRAPKRNDGGPQQFFSFTSVPKVPKKLNSVYSITGLQNAFRPSPRTTLTPAQTSQLYKVAALKGIGRHGEGINIGITNFDGYRLSNLPLFYQSFNLPTPIGGVGANCIKISVDGFDGETAAPAGEGDLDIQLALAMAPRSNLYIYDSNDFVATAVRQANDDVVDIVSESYGHLTSESTRPAIVAAHDQHLAMTLQGITYLLATGDYGTDLLGYDYPNFDPEILQVGGTVATVDPAGNRITEVGWDGSGAGWSTFNIGFNTLPSWLKGTGVPTNINKRIFPDVALHAFGGTGEAYYFVFDGAMSSVSGTSASSPVFAGQLALILQELAAQGAADLAGNGRPRLGRINDMVYELDGDPKVFYDVLGGDAGVLPNGDQAIGKPGWDFVTGWGAPIGTGLLDAFLSKASVPLDDTAAAVSLFTTTKPALVHGTLVQGNVSALPTTDGVTYSVQSVRQVGVGQVAAVAVDFALAGDPAKRRSASATVSVATPKLTTAFIYLYNYGTGKYDVVKTVTGTGATTTVKITGMDLESYLQGSSMRMLVRGFKPTRLGATPFRLYIDQALVTERVARG